MQQTNLARMDSSPEEALPATEKNSKIPEHGARAILRPVQDYSKFSPKEYIQEYYSTIGSENSFLLDFYHRVYDQEVPEGARLLEFGGGPTIYQLLSASRRVSEIVFADYLEVNRREVQQWLRGEASAVNWDHYLDYVLTLEQGTSDERARADLRTRVAPRVTNVIECDAWLPEILGQHQLTLLQKKFDVVSSAFCLECITGDEQAFTSFISKLCALVDQKGLLVLTMLKRGSTYKVGNLNFPVFPVDEKYMQSLLHRYGFESVQVETEAAEHDQGYQGLMAITARRARNPHFMIDC